MVRQFHLDDRNMIWSGGFILGFPNHSFLDFWFPENSINKNIFKEDMSGFASPTGEGYRYTKELTHKICPRMGGLPFYGLGFVFLSWHLLHALNSAFQSVVQ